MILMTHEVLAMSFALSLTHQFSTLDGNEHARKHLISMVNLVVVVVELKNRDLEKHTTILMMLETNT